MALTIDLGRSIFCSLGFNLNLTQHATALVIPPAGTSIPKETQSLEELLEAGEIWLDQAPNIKLQIHIVVGPDLVSPASTFFSQIGEILCHSKLWLDLGLKVLFKSCDHFESDHSETFQLSFGVRKDTNQFKTTRSLRIPTRMRSTHESLPPDGIPTAYLSTIDIHLDYKRCDQWTQRNIPSPLKESCASKKLAHILPIVGMENDEHDDILNEVGYLHPVEYLCPSESIIITDKNEESAFSRESEVLEENWYPIPPLPPKICSLSVEGRDIQLDKEFHTLFDTGFRSLIAKDQRKDKKAIEVYKSEDSKFLSAISPTTFSFGYREAMNQRSQFIPSIASSLASMLERSKNPSLQHRRSLLKLSSRPKPDSSPTPDISVVRTSIKQSLWRIAQKGIYKPEASRNLGLLESVFNLGEGYSTLEHATLFTEPATEEANYIDEEETESYNSYLGSEMDEFESLEMQPESEQEEEQEEQDEEKHTILPAIEQAHTNPSINMLDTTSNEYKDEYMELDTTDLDDTIDANQIDPYYYISPTPVSQKLSSYGYEQPSPSDSSEMLTSDSGELDIMDDPNSLPTTATSMSIDTNLEELFDEDNDDMLCNQP